MTTEELISKLDTEYTLLESFKGMKTKIKVKHSCGNILEVTPSNLLHSYKCPFCYGTFKRNTQKLLDKLYPNQYEIIDEKEMLVKHLKCGTVFKTTINKLKKGIACIECSTKENELQEIEEFLDNLKVPYIKNMEIYKNTFDLCIYRKLGDNIKFLIYYGHKIYDNTGLDKKYEHLDIKETKITILKFLNMI